METILKENFQIKKGKRVQGQQTYEQKTLNFDSTNLHPSCQLDRFRGEILYLVEFLL